MEVVDYMICSVAIVAILAQSFLPGIRHFVMSVGASACITLVWVKTGSISETLQAIPLDVMAILVGLTLFGDFILSSRLFSSLIKWIAGFCEGKTLKVYTFFSFLIFIVSALLNNYQAVLLIIPALIGILSQLEGIKKSFISILLGTVIVLSNLGGASMPISDFPALYMFSQGVISFQSYLPSATPLVIIATVLVIATGVGGIYLTQGANAVKANPLSVSTTIALYRNVKIDKTLLFKATCVFAGMMVFWVYGINPTVVTICGLSILAISVMQGKYLELRIKELDPSIFIFYLCLFAVIATIQRTPLLPNIAAWVAEQDDNPVSLLILFSTITYVVTGVVSAGPSTVVLLPVALNIQDMYPENMVIACFAMSICAGSSLFTFSATAGPLVQSLSEKYDLNIEGKAVSFGFKEYLLPGIIGSAIIYAVNIVFILITLK